MRKNEKKLKRILTMLLSVAIIFTMSSYGNIGVYAEEGDEEVVEAIIGDAIAVEAYEAQPVEELGEAPAAEEPIETLGADTTNDEYIEDNSIVNDNDQTFATRMSAIESEIAGANHIIGPNGDISTNYFTLIMPGETIGVRPDWGLSNNAIQGNITRFDFSVWQLNDTADNSIGKPASTPSFDDTYLTSENSKAKMKGFTPLKSATLSVPFNERTSLEPKMDDASTHKSGPTSVSFTYLYRNDTGLPVVLNQNTTTARDLVSAEGQNDNHLTNFQGFIYYHSNPKMYFLEPSYDIAMNEYCIYDSSTTGPIADVFWPGNVPTKITIDHGAQNLTFPKPFLKGHRFTTIVSGSSFLNYFTDTKSETETSVSFTYNIDTYLNTNYNNTGVITNTAKSHKVSPQFAPGYLTAEFHAQGGTINGKSSYPCEIDNGRGYISIDIDDYAPVKKGYDFKGWCTNLDNPVVITNTTPNVDHDWVNDEYADNFHTDLYAVWGEKESFTVTFEANGATGIMDPVKVYAGDPFILPACGFTAPEGKTFDSWDKGAVGESITVTGNITVKAKWKDKPADEPETKTAAKVEEFTADDITDGIKAAGYETVDAITKQLRLVSTEKGFDEKNSMLYEVKLQISTDGGKTWVDATPDNFPANGLTVKFAYPEGTDSSYDFVIVHMFGTSMNGHTAGQTETFSGTQITKKADGIYVTVTGLSPFLISWKEAAKDATDTITTDTTTTDTTATTPATVTAKETTDTAKKTASSPKTSDETPIALTILLMLDSGLGALYLTLKKHS